MGVKAGIIPENAFAALSTSVHLPESFVVEAKYAHSFIGLQF